MDTRGYAAINVYACTGGVVMLDSFREILRVNLDEATFASGTCEGAWRYLGVFDGSVDAPWSFHPASERADAKLEMRGG